jgi:hypothetical protein
VHAFFTNFNTVLSVHRSCPTKPPFLLLSPCATVLKGSLHPSQRLERHLGHHSEWQGCLGIPPLTTLIHQSDWGSQIAMPPSRPSVPNTWQPSDRHSLSIEIDLLFLESSRASFTPCRLDNSFVGLGIESPPILEGIDEVRCVFVLYPFSTNKNTNKNLLFRNPKGTPYSRHCTARKLESSARILANKR